MMVYGTLLAGAFILYLTWMLVSLFTQIRKARTTGLKWTVFLFGEYSTLWLMLASFESVLYIIHNWLPIWLRDNVNDNIMTHHFWLRDSRTKQFGKLYLVATPQSICCHIADAAVIAQICSSGHGFPKPLEIYGSMQLYGPNVVATEGKEWARHRRHTSAAFGEKTMITVWRATIQQTTQMLASWSAKHSIEKRLELSPKEDILKLTLNVLCAAGFGVQLPFEATHEANDGGVSTIFRDTLYPPSGFKFTLRGVMEYMMNNWNTIFMANTMLPSWLPRALIPFFKDDFAAYDDLEKYMNAMIAQAHQDAPNEGISARGQNILMGLVRAQRLAEKEDVSNPSSLSDVEVLGNTHVMMLAHESTGATIRFILVLLSLHQNHQEWMFQSIREVVRGNSSEWDYTSVCHNLVAPLCVMLETMRMYPPAPVIPRKTTSEPTTLHHEAGTSSLPPYCRVFFCITALHYATEYWGPDAATYDPTRWDKQNLDSFLARNDGQVGNVAAGLESAAIHRPVRGSYIPFSDGLHACLGKKFAQVEVIAFVAVIFSQYKVDLAVSPHQTREDAVEKAKKALDGSICAALALDMVDDVPLSFTPRR